MSPANLALDSGNLMRRDSVFGGDVLLKPVVGANRENLICSELRITAPLAPVVGAVACAIRLVFFGCSPAKVCQNIIPIVAVVVAALVRMRRRRPNEGEQNEAVNLARLLPVIAPKLNRAAELLGMVSRRFQHASSHVANSTKVRDFIEALKAYDGFPVFHVSNYPSLEVTGKEE